MVNGGFIWTLTQKSTFPNEFCVETRVNGKVLQKNPIKAKKSKIGLTVSKWRPNNQILYRDKKIPAKNGKTTFPKEFFPKIWLIIEECKYNHIAEIKFQKSYSVTILGQKQICNSATNLLNYAN